jgi:phosphoserine phosphatase RsbU/P
MRRYVNYVDHKRFVEKLNHEFVELSGEEGMFATAIVGTYWAPTDYLVLCNAGHPKPLRSRHGGDWEFVVCAPHAGSGPANIPLGVVEPARYDPIGLTLRRGDWLIVYTDSLLEARNARGEPLGEAGLLDMVRGVAAAQPSEMTTAIRAALATWRAGAPPEDDVTLLVLRHNGTRPKASLGTLARTVRGFLGAIRDGVARGKAFPWPEARLENLLGPFLPWLNRRYRG